MLNPSAATQPLTPVVPKFIDPIEQMMNLMLHVMVFPAVLLGILLICRFALFVFDRIDDRDADKIVAVNNRRKLNDEYQKLQTQLNDVVWKSDDILRDALIAAKSSLRGRRQTEALDSIEALDKKISEAFVKFCEFKNPETISIQTDVVRDNILQGYRSFGTTVKVLSDRLNNFKVWSDDWKAGLIDPTRKRSIGKLPWK